MRVCARVGISAVCELTNKFTWLYIDLVQYCVACDTDTKCKFKVSKYKYLMVRNEASFFYDRPVFNVFELHYSYDI